MDEDGDEGGDEDEDVCNNRCVGDGGQIGVVDRK